VLWVPLLCLASTAQGAKATFADLKGRAPVLSLPFEATAEGRGVSVSAQDLAALDFKRVGPAWALAAPGEDEVVKLGLVGAFDRGAVTVLVVHCERELPMVSEAVTVLATYTSAGRLLGSLELFHTLSSEAGSFTTAGVLGVDGLVALHTESVHPLMEEGLPSTGLPGELVVRSQQQARLTPGGAITRGVERFEGEDGSFVDGKSKEQLLIISGRVFYRGNERKPVQELLRTQQAVRFKAEGKPYLLTWSAERDALTCRNPDGTTQRFDRQL
jgi:hypothetical protein